MSIIIGSSFARAQSNTKTGNPSSIDVEKERPVLDSMVALYSKYILEGDSVAIASMYAVDGSMGCSKGSEILSSAGSWIRSANKKDSRHVTFKIDTLNADGEFLIETGSAEGRNDKGELKYTFRYLVVWKQENGTWKLYRDISL
jgi:ketosteroid isomerase-like protein